MKLKQITLLITLCNFLNCTACSMFKITENGKTIVGNNEDYFDPFTKIWFTPGLDGQYGVVNMGFGNNFPQGAMNEAGLVFDGFAMDYLAVNDTAGKLLIPNTVYIPYIMHNFSSVRQVQAYFRTINLHHLTTSMYLFVDKSGEYLIVEGDSLIIGNDPTFMLSNFYPSQVSNYDQVSIPFYQKGRASITSATPHADFPSCSRVMSNLHQDLTQYTTIFDLSTGNFILHFFHDYENKLEFNLKEELAKGAHELIIPELFSKESEGYKYYYDYAFDADALVKRIGHKWELAKSEFDEQLLPLITREAQEMLNTIGYEWLRRGQIDGAITIFRFSTELFPKASNPFDSLAEAYMENKQYDLSIKNYKKAIRLNKQDSAARLASQEMLKKVKKIKQEGK